MSQDGTVGITMGDPSGVGPEVICKALARLDYAHRSKILVIGDPLFLARANKLLDTDLQFGRAFDSIAAGMIPVVEIVSGNSDDILPGKVSADGGEVAYQCIERAVELCRDRSIDAIVTAPLNKEALHKAGHYFDGHTGLLAHLTGAEQSFMLLTSEKLSTVHVTTHVSMREATKRITHQRVLATIRAGDTHLKQMGVKQPRIAVAGLNPHCGEGGIFGREDIEQIMPAVDTARDEGIWVKGPIPGDTVFYRAVKDEFDLVVSQYHDQGHAPAKLLAFDTTVNVSLGLPIRRTSVDHGTAYDIAWTGKADHGNMLLALDYARRWARVTT
ncbi:MAG: 4-hydroxythreonine-4-phosphate dehydrogenase PdxA, partial [Desulfobacterales bacterium]|nr:4-hydroxythreonine-4-phosphate dehydrogenase PdxA [Desulfobacterales bacterium]